MTVLSTANACQLADGKIAVAVPNGNHAAGKVKISRLDGTGGTATNSAPFTTKTSKILVVAVGTSHIVGGIAPGPQTRAVTFLAEGGAYAAYNYSAHVFGQNGATAADIRTTYVPQMVAYINSVKAGYSKVIALYEGMINGLQYANMAGANEAAKVQEIIADMRAGCNAVAATGALPVLLTSPPSAAGGAVSPAQRDTVERVRLAVNNDMIANYAQYGAVAVTSTHRDDVELYPLAAQETYPENFADVTHYTLEAQRLWGGRHVVPSILVAAKATGIVPPIDAWENVVWPTADAANMTITGNSVVSSQPQNYTFASTAYARQQIAAGQDGGFRFTVNPALYDNSFLGFNAAEEAIVLTVPVGFPEYGIQIKADGTWGTTSRDGISGTYPWVAGDVLSAQREFNQEGTAADLVYYQNDVEITRVESFLVGKLTLKAATAFPGSGSTNVQMKATGGLVTRT